MMCAGGCATNRLWQSSCQHVGSDGQSNTCTCASRYHGAPVAEGRIASFTRHARVWAQMGNATLVNCVGPDGQCNTCECASRYNGAPVAVERIAPCTHCASVWAQMGNATLMNVLQAKDEPTCSTLLASTEYAGLALSIHEREKGRTCSTPPGPTE
eukprot:scaffold112498_cov20-Tisochrysis_lutea.AAC.1